MERYIPFGETKVGEAILNDSAAIEKLRTVRALLIDTQLAAAEVVRLRLERSLLQRSGASTADGKRLEALSVEIMEAQNAFDDTWRRTVEALKEPGILVVRTNISTQSNLAGRIGAALGFSRSSSRESSSFAILAGIRTRQLFVGSDIKKVTAQPGKTWSLIGNRFPFILGLKWPFVGQWGHHESRVVTSQLCADHMLYVSDEVSARRTEASLQITKDQLAKLDKLLTATDKIEIESLVAAVESLGNMGVLGTAMTDKHHLDSPPSESTSTAPQVIFQVLTDYDDLVRFANNKSRYHFINL
jgi:hypothetical protein